MNNHLIIKNILSDAPQLLSCSATPLLDAEILLAHVLKQPKTFLYTWPEKCISENELSLFQKLVCERCNGKPIAYLVGEKEFWSLKFIVNENVLIPRSETELLVEFALQELIKNDGNNIIDLGTGSGAIAIALGKELPTASIIATDISNEAIQIAQKNAKLNHIQNINFIQSDWFEKIPMQSFDLILSNPPYIEEYDEHLNQFGMKFEPRGALISGADGLTAIRKIVDSGYRYLRSHGVLAIEHGYQQGVAVRSLLSKRGFVRVETLRDFAGCERVTYGRII